jgi:hypothetical protein
MTSIACRERGHSERRSTTGRVLRRGTSPKAGGMVTFTARLLAESKSTRCSEPRTPSSLSQATAEGFKIPSSPARVHACRAWSWNSPSRASPSHRPWSAQRSRSRSRKVSSESADPLNPSPWIRALFFRDSRQPENSAIHSRVNGALGGGKADKTNQSPITSFKTLRSWRLGGSTFPIPDRRRLPPDPPA